MILNKFFTVKEFVPKKIWDLFGVESMQFIDPRLVEIALQLRLDLDRPVTINNWSLNIKKAKRRRNHLRGFRYPNTRVGAKNSMHKKGKALDVSVEGMTSKEVVNFILDNEEKYLSLGLTRLENPSFTKGWVHLDLKETNKDHIYVFKP